MGRKKRSIISTISLEKLTEIINLSSSLAEVIRKLGFDSTTGGNYKTLKNRIKEDGISLEMLLINKSKNKNLYFSKPQIPLVQVLIKGSTYNRVHLKNRLIKDGILKNICAICDQEPIWNGKNLVMRLDHINGINNDNRLENLRLLCPNCDSQQETYGGRKNKKNFCLSCGTYHEKQHQSKNKICRNCYIESTKRNRVVERPSKESLLLMISEKPFVKIGRKFGVSDNAVRKWCKFYNIPYRKKDIKKLKEMGFFPK